MKVTETPDYSILNGILTLFGLLSLAIYLAVAIGLRASNAPGDVGLFLAGFAALFVFMVGAFRAARRRPEVGSARIVLLFAVAFRLAFLLAGLPQDDPVDGLRRDLRGVEPGYQTFLLYDNDVWRYLWDGHLTVTGYGPYERTPNEVLDEVESRPVEGAPLESDLWWDVLDNLSFRTYKSVYPPASQLLFLVSHWLAPGSVLVWKLLIALLDLACCLAVAALLKELGRPPRELIFYAWNPLVIKEFAGSGHVDVWMTLLLTVGVLLLVRQRHGGANVLLGLAISAKLGAAALGPLFWRATRIRAWPWAPVALAATAVPFVSGLSGLVSGLGTYAREWDFNSGPWIVLRTLFEWVGLEAPGLWAHAATKLAILAIVAWSVRPGRLTPERVVSGALWTLGALVVLNPAVMPWYLTWALPFAVALGCRSFVLLTALSFLSYLYYVDQGEATWWLWVEYLGFFAAAIWELLVRRRPTAPIPTGSC